jgi:hypothetical protein
MLETAPGEPLMIMATWMNSLKRVLGIIKSNLKGNRGTSILTIRNGTNLLQPNIWRRSIFSSITIWFSTFEISLGEKGKGI